MAGARMPTPFKATAGSQAGRVNSRRRSWRQFALRLAKKALKPSCASACTRNPASRAAASLDAAARSCAAVKATSRISALAWAWAPGGTFEQCLGDAGAGGIQHLGRHHLMHQPQLLQGRRAQRLGRQKVAPCGALADLAEYERGNDRGYDPESHLREGEFCSVGGHHDVAGAEQTQGTAVAVDPRQRRLGVGIEKRQHGRELFGVLEIVRSSAPD